MDLYVGDAVYIRPLGVLDAIARAVIEIKTEEFEDPITGAKTTERRVIIHGYQLHNHEGMYLSTELEFAAAGTLRNATEQYLLERNEKMRKPKKGQQ